MTNSFARFATFLLLLLCASGPSAWAQDGEFGDYPPAEGDFGGDSFEPPPVAPFNPEEGSGGAPHWEPPPSFAPPAKPQPKGQRATRDPNPGATIRGKVIEDPEAEEDTYDEEPEETAEYEPPPAEAPSTSSSPKRTASRSQINVDEILIPPYQRARPQWALGLLASMKALGSEGAAGSEGAVTVRAFAIQAEFQPRIFQKFGVLGFGPTLTVYPASGLTSRATGLWSAGGQIRYQARYWREQPVVPVAGYSMAMAKYSFAAGQTGSVTVSGPLFGLWILLNVVDQDSAASFYADYGVSRSYLIAEVQMPSGSDENLAFSGNSYYFGMRVEF